MSNHPHPKRVLPEKIKIAAAVGLQHLVAVEPRVAALRDRRRPAWKALATVATCVLAPPLRMGCRSQVRPNHIWLPGLGWQPIDSRLRGTLERVFSVPMIFFALMVLPLFVLEYYWTEQIRA